MAVFDKQGMYESLEDIHFQVEKGYDLGREISIQTQITNIIVAALGGAAIPGYILKQYMCGFRVPINVIEDYELPNFADKNSLVFVIAYGEESEETIMLYKDAQKKGCQIITICSGGKLRELASFNRTKHVNIPSMLQSRLAYPYLFFPMLRILENSRIIDDQNDYIKKTVKILRQNKFEDITENIAEKIISKIPLIYSSTKYEVVAKKWKLDFNETTEIKSFYNVFPAAFHNEIAGFTDKNSDFYILLIKGDDEEKYLTRKVSALKNLLKDMEIPVTEVGLAGECYLAKLFSAILIGDWLSYNLAIKRGVEPSSIRIINELEKRMKL